MSKITTVIIDDEPQARKGLEVLVKADTSLEIIGWAKNGLEGMTLIEACRPQLVLLDVQMPLVDGFELLERLTYSDFQLIFITAHDKYALQAFKVKAIDYLLKPFDDDDFYRAVNRVKKQIDMQSFFESREEESRLLQDKPYIDRLVIYQKDTHVVVKVQDIQSIEAYDTYVKVHTNEKRYIHRIKMEELEKTLPEEQFIRIHRSTIVNMSSIALIRPCGRNDYLLGMDNGKEYRISRSRKASVKKRLGIH